MAARRISDEPPSPASLSAADSIRAAVDDVRSVALELQSTSSNSPEKSSTFSRSSLAISVQLVAIGDSLRRQVWQASGHRGRWSGLVARLRKPMVHPSPRRLVIGEAWTILEQIAAKRIRLCQRLLGKRPNALVRERLLHVWFGSAFAKKNQPHGREHFESVIAVDFWGRVYETLLDFCESSDSIGKESMQPRGARRRKQSGTYYTPGELIDIVLEPSLASLEQQALVRGEALMPLPWKQLPPSTQQILQDLAATGCIARGSLDPVSWEKITESVKRSLLSAAELLQSKVCDPAMGSGAFLVRVLERFSASLRRWLQVNSRCDTEWLQRSLRSVVLRRCLWGVDRDSGATILCRWLLAQTAGQSDLSPSIVRKLRCGDALIGCSWQQVSDGIPDDAFQGDEWTGEIAVRVRQANRSERLTHWNQRTDRFESWLSQERSVQRRLFDAWTAAFFQEGLLRRKETRGRAWVTTQTLLRLAEGKRLTPAQQELIDRNALERRFFHWALEFPEVFSEGGFDAIVGNPPFVNAIEGGLDDSFKQFARHAQPRLHGTADLGYRFLDAALEWVKPSGVIGFILPRAVLNAKAAEKTRAYASERLRPSLIYAPSRKDFFPGAQVYVCGLVLGGAETCRISQDSSVATIQWLYGSIEQANWWNEVQRIASGKDSRGTHASRVGKSTIGDVFEVSASLTARDAYDLRPSVIDRRAGSQLKLITTGLIEPGESLWGKSVCRFLKQDYRWPRIEPAEPWTSGLARRSLKAKRPKILVAGLCSRVEAFLDELSECMGSVGTFSIYHPSNDLIQLRLLLEWLNSERVSLMFREQLGGNAMGGGNITMSKSFLADLPWPQKSLE